MTTIKRIIKGDLVKLISGANKGTTGKVMAVLPKKNAVLVEGIGKISRKVKPSRQNPQGGQRDIHVPTPIHKVALELTKKLLKPAELDWSKTKLVKKLVLPDKLKIRRSSNG